MRQSALDDYPIYLTAHLGETAWPSLRGSAATKQSRLSDVKSGTDCIAYVLRTPPGNGSDKLGTISEGSFIDR
jgi:hypothetical protein